MARMIQTFPLALPGALVDTHRMDLAMLYSKGWGVGTDDVAVAPNGDVYALYHVHRHTWNVAEDEQDPALANFGCRIITRYSADGEVLASALCCPAYGDETASAVANGNDMTLCVLPDGTLSVDAHPDCTTLIAPDLSRVLVTYDSSDHRPFGEFMPGGGFAGSIGVTPSGRLLCSVSEHGVWNRANPSTNIVGLAGGTPAPGNRPVIEAIASLDPEPADHSDKDLRTHPHHRGRQVADEDRLPRWRGSCPAGDLQLRWPSQRARVRPPATLVDRD